MQESVKEKVDEPAPGIETFADGSSLEACPDGSVLLREGRLASALPVRGGTGSGATALGKGVNYNDPPPPPPADGG
jgi:hypothetical protein